MIKMIFAKEGDDTFKKLLAKWVSQRLFMNRVLRDGEYQVIGVMRTFPDERPPLIIAGFLFHDKHIMGDKGKIEVSMAAEDPRWAQRGVIRAVLHYCFVQQNCHVVICMTNRTNKRTRKFLEGIGFTERGTIPNRPYADDTVIYALRVETAIEKGWLPQQESIAA